MIQEIKYTGFTATPSDYECPDGELDAAINLVPEDSELHPVQAGEELFSLEGYDVQNVFIHQNRYKHFIIVYTENDTMKLAWRDENDEDIEDIDSVTFSTGEKFVDYANVGNTIIITTDKQFYFLLWRNDGYDFLGNSIPQIKMAFALDGEVVGHTYTAEEITFVSGSNNNTSEEQWQALYTQVLQFSNVPGTASTNWPYSEWQELNWSFSSGVEYRFSNGTNHNAAAFKYCVQGWNGTEWVAILGHYQDPRGAAVATRRTEKGYTRTFQTSFSKIRVCAYNNYTTAQNISFTLEVFQGVQVSATSEEIIEKTRENLDALLAKINHFREKYVTSKERFIHPFFVRYAVRMYDQSYGYISTPILMIPNSGYVPLLNYHGFLTASQNSQIRAYAFVADLQYAFLNSIPEGWNDVIDGVDIFVSQPIYPYSQDPLFDETDTNLLVYKMLQWQNVADIWQIVLNEIKPIDYGNLSLSSGAYTLENYFEKNLYDVIVSAFDFGNRSTDDQWNVIQIAPKSNEEIMKEVESVKNFYLIHSFDFGQVVNEEAGYHTLKLEDGVLYSGGLVNRTRLEENMLSYRQPKTGKLFEYNNRLHAFNTSFKLPVPTAVELQNNAHFQAENYEQYFDMFVFLRTTEGDKIVKGRYAGIDMGAIGTGSRPWFYYPDSRAYKVWLFYGSVYKEIQLKKHNFLPGVYWIADSLHIGEESNSFDLNLSDFEVWTVGTEPTEIDDVVHEQNTLYVTEANNPFVFIDSLCVNIGCNEIYALSNAAKALSQGQFGQFPLYAFTDNGVWALETSSVGSYIARQPITRDVCINAESITQLDNAVLFATDRGIMLLSGSDSICITDSINSDTVFKLITADTEDNADLLPGLDKLVSSNDGIATAADIVPFKMFLPSARMLYDYTHQRIIVYNPEHTYAYVYSLKSKSWGMMQSNIKYGINSYPECLAIDNDNNIINLSGVPEVLTENAEASTRSCLLITRPLKFDKPDVLKTIDTVIQRGQFRKGSVQSILYGSRDLFHWHLVASSRDHYLRGFRGTPYKYFRIVLLANLQKDESIFGCTIGYAPRLLDQLR